MVYASYLMYTALIFYKGSIQFVAIVRHVSWLFVHEKHDE